MSKSCPNCKSFEQNCYPDTDQYDLPCESYEPYKEGDYRPAPVARKEFKSNERYVSEIINRDDISEEERVYWYSIKTRGGRRVGIPGDMWTKSWGLPQSMYEILEGPLSSLEDSNYGGIKFPSTSSDPDIALEEYKEWERINRPEVIIEEIEPIELEGKLVKGRWFFRRRGTKEWLSADEALHPKVKKGI